ncbi:hypothetical protein M513_05074 [Trichuris suis]|uniref:ISXO2-like transposase domain-containing protein n=1 Tax=Trichuris suis TaxID=68888 RepID=A0A085MA09_9BILA|nr:hypothetical protein M513_05074 [Trichuris suis]
MTKFRDLLWYFLNIRDEESAAAFLREKGVFHRERSCPSCHHQMVLCSRGPNVCPQWRCRNSPCHARLSTRKGTWFEGSRRRLSLEKAIGLIVAWSDELSSLKFCKKHLGLDKSTTVRWNRDLRAVAAEAVGEVSRPIGGPSKTVALDATLFCSGKHNRGWPYARQQWIFGGTCHETGESFVVLVNNRSTATLLPIILRHVQPGTTIVTDEWRAYRCLAQDEFKHVCVNHSLNFVEPSSKARTKTFESMWSQAKRAHQRRCGTHRSALPLHLCESMWRRRLRPGEDEFDKILHDIARLHPPT